MDRQPVTNRVAQGPDAAWARVHEPVPGVTDATSDNWLFSPVPMDTSPPPTSPDNLSTEPADNRFARVCAVAAVTVLAVTLAKYTVDSNTVAADAPIAGVHNHAKAHPTPKVVHPSTETSAPNSVTQSPTPFVDSPSASPSPSLSPSPSTAPTSKPTHGPAIQSTGEGSTVVLGTYNQKNRLSTAAHIAGIDMFVKRHVDIIGTQETGPHKYHDYLHELAIRGYGLFPKTHYDGYDQLCARNDAIAYNKKDFKPVHHEFLSIPQYPEHGVKHCSPGESAAAGHANAPIVFFADKHTGQVFIVMNTHNIANVREARGHHPDKRRYMAAERYDQKVAELQQRYPGIPVFLVGDFNEGTGVRYDRNSTYQYKARNLTSHMFEKNGRLNDASCMNHACHYRSIGGVDFIYAGVGVKTDSFHTIPIPRSHSDHAFKYSKETIPESYNYKVEFKDARK